MKKILILIVSLFSISILNCSDKEKKEREERGLGYHGGAAADQQVSAYESERDEDSDYEESDYDYRESDYLNDPELGEIEKTDLIDATLKNNEVDVRKALSKGENPNGNISFHRRDEFGYNRTEIPLMIAAFKGYENIVKILLDAGADKDLVDRDGHSAAFYAEQQNHPNIAKLLREFKVNPVKIAKWKLEKELLPGGSSREITSQSLGYIEEVDEDDDVPKNARKIFTAIKRHSSGLLHKALHEKEDVNAQTSVTRRTPLMYAAELNRPGLVKLLLKANADTSLVDKDGKRFIDYARQNPQVMEIVNQYRNYIAAIMSGRIAGTKTPRMSKDVAKEMTKYLV